MYALIFSVKAFWVIGLSTYWNFSASLPLPPQPPPPPNPNVANTNLQKVVAKRKLHKMARERSGTQTFQGDSILFHGSKVPSEVRKMFPLLGNLKLEKFTKLLQGNYDSYAWYMPAWAPNMHFRT